MARGAHGGKRNGVGRPKGALGRSTLEKEAARELVRQTITAQLGPLLDAQIAHAIGIKYLVVRDRATGKFQRVTEAAAIGLVNTLNTDEEIIEVWEKDPSVQAFTDLLNRALDKPREQVQELKITGDDDQVRRLHAGRARAAKARKEKP